MKLRDVNLPKSFDSNLLLIDRWLPCFHYTLSNVHITLRVLRQGNIYIATDTSSIMTITTHKFLIPSVLHDNARALKIFGGIPTPFFMTFLFGGYPNPFFMTFFNTVGPARQRPGSKNIYDFFVWLFFHHTTITQL